MSFPTFLGRRCRTEAQLKARLTAYMLLLYAASKYGQHAFGTQDMVREYAAEIPWSGSLVSEICQVEGVPNKPSLQLRR